MVKKVQGFAFELDEGLISEDQCTYALHFINSTNKQNWLRDPWVGTLSPKRFPIALFFNHLFSSFGRE